MSARRTQARGAPDAVPFDDFMRQALYGPDGFYTSARTEGTGMIIGGGRAGRRGDFLTSPEVGPLFGVVVARWIDSVWRDLGEPDGFVVVDAGAGPGTLARSIRAAAPAWISSATYLAVEISAAQRADHPDGVESRAVLPDGPLTGVVIANELLDNLPFRLAVNDGGWREAYAVREPDGSWTERLSSPFHERPAVLPASAAHGARAPLVDEASGWVADVLERIERGALLAIDYAVGTTGELVARPWRSWLRTYRGNERGEHYLRAPGSQDITTEIPLDQLPTPDRTSSQADFLRRSGIDELVEEGRRGWNERVARPDLRAMAMRSRVAEAEALLDPAGLGSFVVAEWRR